MSFEGPDLGWNRFVSVGQLKKLKPLKGGVVMDRFREGEGPPVFFIEVAVMIAQQKALDGNAVSSDACEANRRALSRVQQNDCVVGTQRNDVLFLDWPKRAQRDGSIA